MRFLILLAFLTLSLFGTSALADDYAAPSWADLSRTLVRFNAISLSDPTLIDEYAVITECALYKAFYHDDFKWNQVRTAIRDSAKNNVATYPMDYHYDVKLQLDRYDFDTQTYRFTAKSTLHNVNTFVLFSVQGTDCGDANVKYMPRIYRAVLAAPLYMEGLPLADKDAQALLKLMNDDKNTDRIVYARFNMRIVYIDPLRKETTKTGEVTTIRYRQSNTEQEHGVRLDARLDSIDFYEDPELTHLIYKYETQ